MGNHTYRFFLIVVLVLTITCLSHTVTAPPQFPQAGQSFLFPCDRPELPRRIPAIPVRTGHLVTAYPHVHFMTGCAERLGRLPGVFLAQGRVEPPEIILNRLGADAEPIGQLSFRQPIAVMQEPNQLYAGIPL